MEFPILEKVLSDYGLRVVEKYRHNLTVPIARGKNRISAPTTSSGTLYRSVKSELVREGDRFELWIDFGVEYWHWLEYGTRQQGPYRKAGKWPPFKPIADWVRTKPVVPFKGKNGRMPTTNQLVFLIRRKIGEEGTQPLRLLEKSLENGGDIAELCAEAVRRDFRNMIEETIYGRDSH